MYVYTIHLAGIQFMCVTLTCYSQYLIRYKQYTPFMEFLTQVFYIHSRAVRILHVYTIHRAGIIMYMCAAHIAVHLPIPTVVGKAVAASYEGGGGSDSC